MKSRPSLLQAILWNQILWLVPIIFAMMFPVFVLAFLGIGWFTEAGHWCWLLLLSVSAFFVLWSGLLTLRHFRLPKHSTAERENQAKREVERFVRDFDYTTLTFQDGSRILDALKKLNAVVARTYGIRSKNPELDLPLSYVLLAVERISADMELFLSQKVNFLSFKPLEWIYLRHILRFLPGGKELLNGKNAIQSSETVKNSAKKKETKKTKETKSDADSMNTEASTSEGHSLFSIPAWVYQKIFSQLFKLAGHYSVMIYSGRLLYQCKPDDAWKFPLRIAVPVLNPLNVSDFQRNWLEKLRETTDSQGVRRLLQKGKITQTTALAIPDWGEIHLTEPILEEKKSNNQKLALTFVRALTSAAKKVSGNAFFTVAQSQSLIPEEFWKSDLLFLFVDSSIENSESLRKTMEEWWLRPFNERPDPVFVTDSSENEDAIKKMFQTAEWLNVSEVHFWSIPFEEEKSMESAGSSSVETLTVFCDSMAETLCRKKQAETLKTDVTSARLDRQNGFFRSRFVTWQWMLALYGVVLFGCFVIGGIFYSQEKAAHFLQHTTSSESVTPSASESQLIITSTEDHVRFSCGWWKKIVQKHGLSIFAAFGGLTIVFLWLKFNVRIPPLKVDAEPDWPEHECAGFEKIRFTIDSLKISDLQGIQPILRSFGRLLECVDRHYGGKDEAHFAISLAEVLKAQQILTARVRRTLAKELPGMDYLRLRDLHWGLKLYTYYAWTYEIYRKLIWFDPISATVLELRRRVNQSILKSFSTQFQSSVTIYGLELAGHFALELYSGHLFHRPFAEPVAVFLVGCTGAGHRKLRDLFQKEPLKLANSNGETASGPQEIQWFTTEKDLDEEAGFLASLFGKKSPFERCAKAMRSADMVCVVTDEEDGKTGTERSQLVKSFLKEFREQESGVEKPPILLCLHRSKVDSLSANLDDSDSSTNLLPSASSVSVLNWGSDETEVESLRLRLADFFQKRNVEIQLRQTFRILRAYTEKHPR